MFKNGDAALFSEMFLGLPGSLLSPYMQAKNEKTRLEMRSDGLYAIIDGQAQRQCQPFEADLAKASDRHGEIYRVRFQDRHGQSAAVLVFRKDLHCAPSKVAQSLVERGFDLDRPKQALHFLCDYLYCLLPETGFELVERLGFHGSTFVQPVQNIGPQADSLFYAGEQGGHGELAQAGTLEGWKQTVVPLCRGNHYLVAALCFGFAAALSGRLELPTFGIHLYGDSRTGKTTLLKLANSIFRRPGHHKDWQSSEAGLEQACQSHHSTLLCLDEIGRVPRQRLADRVYQICNERPRTLHNSRGESRLLFFSTGEISMQKKLETEQTQVMAGHVMRLFDLPLADDRPYGAFDVLHDRRDAAALASELRAACESHYGVAGQEFIKALTVQDVDTLRTHLETLAENLRSAVNLTSTSSKTTWVITCFALWAVAGELATEWGLTGFDPGEATAAVSRMLEFWLGARRGYHEEKTAYYVDKIRQFVHKNAAHFRPASSYETAAMSPQDLWGIRVVDDDITLHAIKTRVFSQQILKGEDLKHACTLLCAAGVLRPGAKAMTATTRFPNNMKNPAQAYVLADLFEWAPPESV